MSVAVQSRSPVSTPTPQGVARTQLPSGVGPGVHKWISMIGAVFLSQASVISGIGLTGSSL